MVLETNSPEFKAVVNEIVNYIGNHPKKKWMEQEEVEEVYSIKRTQFYELKASGILKSKKIGSKVLVSVESIEKFLNS